MNKKLLSIIFSIFLLFPSFSYAICEGQIMPCGYDIDGDGTFETEIDCVNTPKYTPSGSEPRCLYETGDQSGDGNVDWEGCTFCHIFKLASNIIVYVMTCLTPIVSGVMLILGGFYFMIAGVDPTKAQKGKEIATAAIIGLVVIFVSWILLNTFLTSMGIAEWTGLNPESGQSAWWEIKCNP